MALIFVKLIGMKTCCWFCRVYISYVYYVIIYRSETSLNDTVSDAACNQIRLMIECISNSDLINYVYLIAFVRSGVY